MNESNNQKVSISSPGKIGVSIVVDGLSKRFNREWIFRNLAYQFEAGRTYAITGPNGSGKSTFLQVLSGQTPPTTGSLSYSHTLAGKLIAIEDIYKCISIAAPYMDLIDEFTLDEQIKFHFSLKKIRDDISIERLLEIINMKESRNKFMGNFSSGMKQRVKLALAFYTSADIVLLDEPGTNLDKQAFEWYRSELQNLEGKSLILIASNNPLEYPKNTAIVNILDYKA